MKSEYDKEKLQKFLKENPPIELGYVYLIKKGKYYKIGKSKTFTYLKTVKIVKVAYVWGYDTVQKNLLDKYAELNTKGKGFCFTEKQVKEIKQLLEAKDYPEFRRV